MMLPQDANGTYAQTQERQGGFRQDCGAKAHGAGNNQLRDNVGDQVAEDAVPCADTAGFGCRHELLLAQGEDLAADRRAMPGQPRKPRISIRYIIRVQESMRMASMAAPRMMMMGMEGRQ